MCPPTSIPSAVELNQDSTDETICKSLMQFQSGHILPANVLSDVNPHQFPPSNLPDEVFYYWSGSKTETKDGFWRSTGEAREIYKTSLIICLRKTFQFFEGSAHDGQKTNWIMQEYTTAEKYTSKLDPRSLYRVFLVDDFSSGDGHLSKGEPDVAGPSDVANHNLNQLLDDYVSEGDYLELDDLATPLTPLSRTSSSANSSCMTMSMTSEDLFDADALLCELDDGVDQEIQDSKVKLNLSVPAKLKQVVMQPTTLGSVNNIESEPRSGQTSKTNPTSEDNVTSNEADAPPPSQEPPPSSPPPSSSLPPPLSSSSSLPPPSSPPQLSSSLPLPASPQPILSSPPPSSSNSSEGSSKEEKRERANRSKKRKMMKYLCFLAF